MNNVVNFLIENNYADTELAASKILEASSDQFLEFLLQEMNQQQHDSLKRRIANARTPEEKERLQRELNKKLQSQRDKILSKNKPKSKQVIRPYIKGKLKNSRTVKAVKRFLKYTGLGVIGSNLL